MASIRSRVAAARILFSSSRALGRREMMKRTSCLLFAVASW
jgi:hypothetical protein